MTRYTFVATAIAVMAGTVMSADYLFPSANPPAGKKPTEVKQYVSFIWDDNGYSGELGTPYEPDTGTIAWDGMGIVGGNNSGVYTENNPLNIGEGDMGLSWARMTLGSKMAGKGVNGNGHMTFNMISGLFVETKGTDWNNRVSKYGSYDNGTTEGKPWIVAAANGREQRILDDAGQEIQKPWMVNAVKKLIADGHEIGNHTLDHIETNSPYPLKRPDGSDLWPNGGEGFDGPGGKSAPGMNWVLGSTDALGNPWSEATEFGASGPALQQGWQSKIGKVLSKDAWNDLIELGEEDGVEQSIYSKSDLYGFRAPRLEINSNMFYALKEQGYLYDCGVEEGMEMDVDGTNFLWPYTTDNGVPNFYTQIENGETVAVDSLPAGLWEVPVNLVMVHPDDRQAVFNTYDYISDDDIGTFDEWDGKVTGFDFNMFVLFGMTKEQAQRALEYTLDLHYDNNRAPMQVGCHTDYFTPMYDFATLSADATYKKVLEFNTWTSRKAAWEGFVDYAAGKPDVRFVTGKELIEEIKSMQSDETVPTGVSLAGDAAWEFLTDDVSSVDNADATTFMGDGFQGNITLKASDDANSKYAYSSYMTYFDAATNQLDGISHISLDYNSNVPLAIRFYVENDNVVGEDYAAGWEVIVNNKGHNVSSGPIPVSAFAYGQYSQGERDALETAKITTLEIAPLGDDQQCVFNISNIKLHGANNYSTPILETAAVADSKLSIAGMTRNNLNVSIANSGLYTVKLFTANGRLVRSINAGQLSTGLNSIDLGGVPAGLYMVEIAGDNASVVTKAFAM